MSRDSSALSICVTSDLTVSKRFVPVASLEGFKEAYISLGDLALTYETHPIIIADKFEKNRHSRDQ